MLRVGIVGTGGMAKVHAHCFMRNPHCQVAAVSGHTQKNTKAFARGKWGQVSYSEPLGEFTPLYPIPKTYSSAQELAKDPHLDFLVIASPNALHYEQARAALLQGKHLLIEKPVTVGIRQAEKLLTLAQKLRRTVSVGQVWRFHPEVEAARHIVARGKIGKIVKVKSFGIHTLWGPSGWFRDPALAGGGALLDMGVHGLDAVLYVLGQPQARVAFAHLKSAFSPREPSPPPFFIDDLGVLCLELNGEIPCILESGWDHPVAEGGEATSLFLGERGYVRFLPFAAAQVVRGKLKPIKVKNLDITMEALYQKQADHFVQVLLGRKQNSVIPLDIGVDSMRILERAYRLAQRSAQAAHTA